MLNINGKINFSVFKGAIKKNIFRKFSEIKFHSRNMDEKQTKTLDDTSVIEIPETKDDNFDNIEEHKTEIENHKKSIYRTFVSHYINEGYGDDYVVTYSDEDESFLGWLVNIEENGPQQPDVYFKTDRQKGFRNSISIDVLCKKILSLRTYNENCKYLF